MENKKDTFIKFRITEKEKKQIILRAEKSNKNLSDFARFMLINGEVIIISNDDRRVLAGLANNINQLVKLFHQTKKEPKNLVNELSLILTHLKNAYRRSS